MGRLLFPLHSISYSRIFSIKAMQSLIKRPHRHKARYVVSLLHSLSFQYKV